MNTNRKIGRALRWSIVVVYVGFLIFILFFNAPVVPWSWQT